MTKTSKLLLGVIGLGVAAAAVAYFLPAKEKEIITTTPQNTENAVSEVQPNTETPIEKPEESGGDGKKEEKIPIFDQKEEKTTSEPEKNIRIIQKPITWGFSAPSKKRSIDTIIVHSSYNALGGDTYDLDKLIEEYRQYGVSTHYLIDRKGNVYQLVKNQNVAYHAGESVMPDRRTNVNTFSLGIELMNTQEDTYTDAQYNSLNELIAYLKQIYPIENVLGHNQIAPGRKTDPWNFDWKKITQ